MKICRQPATVVVAAVVASEQMAVVEAVSGIVLAIVTVEVSV